MFTPDQRAQRITKYLLDATNPISTREIADTMKVSTRQVRYSLAQIDVWLKKNGLQIVKKPGTGVQIHGTDNRKELMKEILTATNSYPSFYKSGSRKDFILLTFFFSNQPILIKQLCYKLNASRSTIIRDLKCIRYWLKRKELFLISKPNYGFEISGKEIHILEAFVELLMRLVGEDYLTAILIATESSSELEYKIKEKFPEYLADNIYHFYNHHFIEILNFFRKNASKNIADNTYLQLAFIFNVSIFRINNGHLINDYDVSIENEYSKMISTALIKEHIKDFDNDLFKDELNFFAGMMDRQFNQRHLNKILPTLDNNIISMKVLSEEILETVSKKLHPSLLVNEELSEYILSILAKDTTEVSVGISTDDDIQRVIIKQHPQILSLVEEIRRKLDEKYHFNLNDRAIEKLTLCLIAAVQNFQTYKERKRILIVCNTGSITAWLLESRIRNEFPELDIVGKSSVLELASRDDLGGIDFIVTTISLGEISTPFIVINPLLEKEDNRLIRNMISKQRGTNTALIGSEKRENQSAPLASLLGKDTIQLQIEANNWIDVVEKSGAPLVALRTVEPSFVSAMKNIIIENGPYMVLWPGIALLHAHSTDGVNHLSMSLTTFKNAIPFGHEKNDPVDIAIVIATVDKYSHCDAVEQMIDIINDTGRIKRIRQSNQVGDVIDLIQMQ